MQKMKLLKIKYGWDANATDSNIKFANRMIKVNGPDLIADIHEFVEYDTKNKIQIYITAIHTLAQSGHLAIGFKLLDSLDENIAAQVANSTFRITAILIEDEIAQPEIFDNLMELMKHIITSKGIGQDEKCLYRSLLKIQILRDHFELIVKSSALRDARNVDQYLKKGISHLIQKLNEAPPNFVQKAWANIQLLAKALDCNAIDVTIKLAKQLKNVQFTCAIAKYVLDMYTANHQNCNEFIQLAVLLIVQQTAITNSIPSMSYPVAHQLLLSVQSVSLIYSDEIRDLINWTRIGNHAYDLDQIETYFQQNDVLDNTVSNIIFLELQFR